MNVSELIQRDVVTLSCRDRLERAAQLMWEYDIGCLPVIDEARRVVGILTDRDVCMAAFLQGAPLRAITIASVMSKEVATCRETDHIAVVERAMCERRVRRMPVVDADGALVGMIALSDLARAAHAGALPAASLAATLVAISHPRIVRPPVVD